MKTSRDRRIFYHRTHLTAIQALELSGKYQPQAKSRTQYFGHELIREQKQQSSSPIPRRRRPRRLIGQVGLSLSGFPHNGVSVFGGLTPVPIILSEAVLTMRPAYVWMGAGHPLLKLGISAKDLVKAGAIEADISTPRTGAVGEGDADEC